MIRRLAHLLCGFAILLFVGHRACAQHPSGTPGPLTIVVQPVSGKLTFELNGHPLSGDFLDALNRQFAITGAHRRVNVLFHQDISLTRVLLTMATVGKVGFADCHVYVFDQKRLTLTEIQFGKEQSFTINP